MAKKDDNTVTWVLLGVGALFLFEKIRGSATITPPASQVIQKNNPVITTSTNNTNPLISLVAAGGKALSNLFNGGSASNIDIQDQPAPAQTNNQPLPDAQQVYDYGGDVDTEINQPFANQLTDGNNRFEYSYISGIPPVKKRHIDEND